MAKKSTAARGSGAARRPQTTAKNPSRQATLVRAPGAGGIAPTARGATPTTETRKPLATSAPQSTAAPAKSAAKPAATAATPATVTRPAPRPAAASSARAQATRVARAQATQRARTAHLISAENYAYVLNDLRLTGILAAAMFLVIIVLHFVIG
jgi:ribosome-associated protein